MFAALDQLPVGAHVQVGQVQPREQADPLGRRPVLRPIQQGRQDRWVFGDRKSGAYLHKFTWTNIVRHQIVKGAASPDDPALADYWAKRRRKSAPADRQDQPVAHQSPGRSLPDLRGRAPARRRPATNPARVGTVADDHPQDDRQGRHPARRRAGRTRTPSRTRPLPRRQQRLALLPAYEPAGLA